MKENFKSEINFLNSESQIKLEQVKNAHEAETKIRNEFFDNKLKEKDSKIESLSDNIEGLNKTLNEKEEAIRNLKTEIKEKLERIKSLETEILETKRNAEMIKETYNNLQIILEREYQLKNVR
jgi:chromosome segregation ATPase